jgi:ATP-independent RNA helicase DbpA
MNPQRYCYHKTLNGRISSPFALETESSVNSNAFSSLPLEPALLDNIAALGYTQLTPIQAEALPHILDGKDIIAQAKTGSGKTAAFGIGLLSRIDFSRFSVQALVICPTRELADQVCKELRLLARFTQNVKILSLCGGVPSRPQADSLEHGIHIVVGTPGRLQEHLGKRRLLLSQLQVLVLDEADRMLDMGFAEIISDVLSYAPKQRQTLLFSATYSDPIRAISQRFQNQPITVSIDSRHHDSAIEQRFYQTEKAQRLSALGYLLAHHRPESTVVFCNTKRECQDLAVALDNCGFSVQALHGDLDQSQRDQVLVRFANQSCSILVATDVAARGLDIKDLQAVINYELPWDPEIYVHRIGRTGRAGKPGLALTLCLPEEMERVIAVEDYLKMTTKWDETAPFKMVYEDRYQPPMATLWIDGGRKNKLRPGDILGALTGEGGIAGSDIGKIDIFDDQAFVAIRQDSVDSALAWLKNGKIKGKSFMVRKSK